MTLATFDRSNHTASWNAIFERYGIHEHDFDAGPFEILGDQIKDACQHFQRTSEKEVRILCKQDSRESRPQVFRDRGLFILPVRNGIYAIIKGEGYVDVPSIQSPLLEYHSDFPLGRAYALSLARHFFGDDSLVLTIRGRKYTPAFSFVAGGFQLDTESVQTEVDGGYEGANQVVLVESKNGKASNTIIRQLYYPFRQWQQHTAKPVSTFFFQRRRHEYHLWHFGFDNPDDYNSIRLLNSARYRITVSFTTGGRPQ